MALVDITGNNAPEFANRTLMHAFARDIAGDETVEIVEIRPIPVFHPETPPEITALVDAIAASDGVVIATPKYNHTIPAPLKSALEWLSSVKGALTGKPVMIIGASYGRLATSRAQLHLRQVLDAPGVHASVMPGNEFLLGEAHTASDADGNLTDEGTIAFLESCLKRFLRVVDVANLLNLSQDIEFEPGTYSVTAVGCHGRLPMEVTLGRDRIEDISIDTSTETQGIADVVFTRIPEQIIQGQTLNSTRSPAPPPPVRACSTVWPTRSASRTPIRTSCATGRGRAKARQQRRWSSPRTWSWWAAAVPASPQRLSAAERQAGDPAGEVPRHRRRVR